MRTIENKKKILAEFISQTNRRFVENGGRLLIVEQSKSLAVRELNFILKNNTPNSFLCMVEDGVTADEFSRLLSPVLGKICVIDSLEKFEDVLKETGTELSAHTDLRITAAEFKRLYPVVIITAKDKYGKSVLNHAEFSVTDKLAALGGKGESAPYCISDFLAECAYGFVVIDNIYGFISVNAKEPLMSRAKKSPSKFEKFDFMNFCYYFDTEHSVKRLKNITAAADNCVLLSDVITVGEVFNFYIALTILTDRFSLNLARKQVKRLSVNYAEDCEHICGEVSYCQADEVALSSCMSFARTSRQIVPSDIDSMQKHLTDKLHFMSSEEIFLRVITAYLELFPQTKVTSTEDIIDAFENDENASLMARCFAKIFFDDKIKGKLEGNLATGFLGEMGKEDVEFLFNLIAEYGSYHRIAEEKACKLALLFRDDSGFEYFARTKDENDTKEKNYGNAVCYSLLGHKNDWYHKCSAIEKMLNGKDEKIKLAAPLLIVTDGDNESVAKLMAELMPNYNVSLDYETLNNVKINEKTIVVSDYTALKNTALWFNDIGSAVFIDITPDIGLFGCVLNKITAICEQETVAFATYGTLDGYMTEHWASNFEVFDKGELIPMSFGGYVSPNGKKFDYADVIFDINEVYVGLGNIVNGLLDANGAKSVAKKFNKLISDYTLIVPFSAGEINADTVLLSTLGKVFSDIYGEAISVGGRGDSVEKISDTSAKKVEYEYRQLFNVCLKVLRRKCNLKTNNCAGCPEYSNLMRNNFAKFKLNIAKFFEETKAAVVESEIKKQEGAVEATIRGVDADNGGARALAMAEIETGEAKVNERLKEIIDMKGKSKGFFSVPYETVEDILKNIANIYTKLLNKYYSEIMSIFHNVSEQAVKNYQTVTHGFTDSVKSGGK